MEVTMDEEEIGLKIEDIMCTFKNMDGGPGKLIVGVSKAMEQINDLIDKHKKNEEAPPSLSQETLLTLLTIVGREVDLHTNNGDVYTGILYVVSPETELGIQLKQCKLGNGIIVDTQDIALNQISKIVAKGVTVLVENLGRSFLILDEQPNYQIDIQRISSGEDTRSSLIIKNIPKRYTSEMLISEINDTQPGTFDFIYLPLVKKDRRKNVGYAFINMLSPSNIISFYQAFNGKNWDKLQNEKVASIAYARVQGKDELIMEYVMKNEDSDTVDMQIRPTVFFSESKYQEESVRYRNLNVRIHQPEMM
ncbi:protein MEI2-like 2-like [Trifolium medium]|uniref:Protein MEI2-like 2-like n=3 Tax=Trifolium TaxID=3898 RepID=A0A2K3PHI8_TRIPR|nr:protein MEI2-like 2-like [Trifolium medium]PNY14762.1 protein MEI2-like 2-like [Trifolium pratense]